MIILSKGSKGEKVRKMQLALNRANCSCGVDGIFGDETEQALISFQIGQGVRVDGLCGDETWACLERYMVDYTELRNAVEKCLDAVEALPEYKALEEMLYA